jgi:hypothetical protein
MVATKNGQEEEPRKDEKTDEPTWSVGDFCRAVYTEDGIEYEGKILALDESEGKKYCNVQVTNPEKFAALLKIRPTYSL